MAAQVAFCATGKTGLGHLRRTALIAHALHRLSPDLEMILLSNAPADALSVEEEGLFSRRTVVERSEMADSLRNLRPDIVVVDTAVIPNLSRVEAALCLVLRAVRPKYATRFRPGKRRQWDLILSPHPRSEWDPVEAGAEARRVESIGWVYRRAATTNGKSPANRRHPVPRLLVASGGGGNEKTATVFCEQVAPVLRGLRRELGREFEAVRVSGPRNSREAGLPGIDRIVHPGSRLPALFAESQAVISTAGYNSVLELATVPAHVLLTAIPRRYDDQKTRARLWGPRLGKAHDPRDPEGSVAWLTRVLTTLRSRPTQDLGPSGAEKAARLLLEMIP